jgi:ascorbate PTS system EIIB component
MKILCVCGLGQGSSLILRMNVEDLLKSRGISADVDNTDASSASFERCDYIITSNEIAENIKNPTAKIITVSNYFNKTIIEKEIGEILGAEL